MNTKKLKAFHFVLSWLATLLIGLIIGALFFGPGGAFLTTVIAAICSLPFIAVFTLLMHQLLKKDLPKVQVHLMTFGMHFIGSILVFFVLVMLGTSEAEQGYLFLIMTGYFAIDTIFFHVFIQTLYKKAEIVRQQEDILDDFELS